MAGALIMGESKSQSDVFNELAYEFAERYRSGERPALTEYTDRYPELAEEIRELFPALVMMEQLGSGDDQLTGRVTSRIGCEGPTPEQLGDYRILREIGRGGMGVVYEAVQESLGRRVALKVLVHNRQLGPTQLIRFQREARAAALLHHTNIVPVFGVGVHEGVHYLAMQYIRGESLEAVLREVIRRRRDVSPAKALDHVEPENRSASLASRLLTGRLSPQPLLVAVNTDVMSPSTPPGAVEGSQWQTTQGPDRPLDGSSSTSAILGRKESHYFHYVARIGVQAADALAYAHLYGIVHRDIKPANLLLDIQGTLWVTDFGLAKSEGTDELTTEGDVIGTLRYMAPERFQGKGDPRCDMYSLGVTLYEMLTLKPAFRASQRVQLVHAILHDEPVRPRKSDPQIPRDLETIVLKAIAKNPSDRFATAGDLARELERFVEGRPIRSRRISLPERLWRWSRRNPAMALLILLAATLTSILAIGSTVAAWRFREQRDAVRIEESRFRANLKRALVAERAGREELGRSLLVQARALRHSRQPGRRSDALERLKSAVQIAQEVGSPSEYLAELRDEVIASLALTDDRTVQTWEGLNLFSFVTACCIDADRYVVLGSNGSMHVYRLSDRSLVRVVGSDRPADRSWPQFVPGGQFVYVLSGSSQTELWDIERGVVPAAWPGDVRCLSPRLDGRHVAALRSDGELRVYNLPSLTEASRCRLGVDVPRRLRYPRMSLSEDGQRLALIHPDQTRAGVYEAASGRVVRELSLPSTPPVEALALSRNGRILAIVQDRSIAVYDLADGEQIALLQGHYSEEVTAQFQPGGNWLVSTSWDGTTRLWDPIRGRLLLSLRGTNFDWTGNSSRLAVSRDRQMILHQIGAGDVLRTIECRMLEDRAGRAVSFPTRVAYSPDGQLIVIPMRPDVLIARASDGVILAHLPIGFCDQAIFQPGGTLLTHSDLGLCRWPARRLAGGTLQIGPPEPLGSFDPGPGFIYRGLSTSASGRLVGAASQRLPRPVLLDPERPWRRTWLRPHESAPDLSISPDGRWVATGGRGTFPDNDKVKIWDAATGRLLAQFAVGNAKTAFSADSQWLGVGGAYRYRFYRTGSWTPGPEFDHGEEVGVKPLAFHPGGRIAAILDSRRLQIRLVDLATGRLLAQMVPPEDSITYGLTFSPDGRFLAAAQTDRRVDVWDLSAIRRRLAELDLAEGIPDLFGGSTTAADAPAVDRIEVVGGDPAGLRLLPVRQTLRRAYFDFRALLDSDLADTEELFRRSDRWVSLGQWRLGADDYSRAFAGGTLDAPHLRFQHAVLRVAAGDLAGYRSACNHMLDVLNKTNGPRWLEFGAHAWVIAPEGPAATTQALQLAKRRAAALHTPWSDHVLGLALYRAGRFAEADTRLRASLDRNSDWDARVLDWLVIAMAQKQLGRPDEARRWLERAESWVVARLPGRPGGLNRAVPENWHWRDGILLHLLLREARALDSQGLPDLPVDVFAR
jgi:serine/threonine protein kinase/WD40 repeat protein